MHLYTIDLPNADAQTTDDRVQAQIEQAGLLQEGGIATEKIAADEIDVTVDGQWRYGKRFSKKAARELESLAASNYNALPLFELDGNELDRKTGYYELQRAAVTPEHETSEDVYEYTIGLSETGTRETHWRAVRTTVETVDTLHTGTDPALIGVPTEASKTQWYDPADGTEPASATDTVNAEFGDVDRYDPDDASFSNPTLLFELPFEREGRVDCRVWDDRGREKFWMFESLEPGAWGGGTWGSEWWPGTVTLHVTQWAHVYHTAAEFDGAPVIDTGLLRLDFSGGADRDDIGAETWDDGTDTWTSVTFDDTISWTIFDVDLTRIGPASVEFQLLLTDDSGTVAVNGAIDRGYESVLWTEPDGEDSIPQAVIDLLEPVARKDDTDVAPGQTVIARSETRR